MVDGQRRFREQSRLVLLVCFHVVICCASLCLVLRSDSRGFFDIADYHLSFDPGQLYPAVAVVAAFAVLAALFAIADFSFGYFVGFYFFTMILSYLWLNCFSESNYDHRLGGLSAAASGIAFLLPALLISSPIRQVYVLSERRLERLLKSIVVLARPIRERAVFWSD
jgi:hypothetical protein